MDANPSGVSNGGGDQKSSTSQQEIANASNIKGCQNGDEVSTTSTAPKECQPVSGGKGGKHASNNEKKVGVSFDEKIKTEAELEVTELLGSVQTQNCPGTRTSARVIQKMKQDQSRPVTPPITDHRATNEKGMQKTPSQLRANKPSWTNLERNHFFDAVNEFGKDFEAIGNYINAKLKRKSTTDFSFKTKDQVRQHYYQTFHKICKYIKFSDEVKKPTQELYALINYGEMRRKLQFVTDKHFMKLKNLVYQGDITVRCKGKNIRVKTPSCRALRKLNQLDDSLEDIRLPSKIEVAVSPANIESFGRVQTIAQNPRARTTVPLQKKLLNFIKTFQYKWRSHEMKLVEDAAKLFPQHQNPTEGQTAADATEKPAVPAYQDPEICFKPKPGVPIHRPLLSITEYLSSVNICLSAYEDRMGVKVRGEMLNQDRNGSKRLRTESGSEKKSPDSKKHKQINSPLHESASTNEEAIETEIVVPKSESSGDEFTDEITELLSDIDQSLKEESEQTKTAKIEPIPAKIEPTPAAANSSTLVAPCTTAIPPSTATPAQPQIRSKRGANTKASRTTLNFKPLISSEVISRIRKGWTVSNAADITIGDLYVVLGQDSKLELEYYWTDAGASSTADHELSTTGDTHNPPVEVATPFTQKQNGLPYNPSECDDPNLIKSISTASIGNKLKHLLLIANLSERIRKRQCSCGHTCERNAIRTRIERGGMARSFVSNRTYAPNNHIENRMFRQPAIPIRRPMFSTDPVKQLNTLSRSKMSRQILVQRLLLPGSGTQSYDLLDLKNLQNNLSESKQYQQRRYNHDSEVASTSSGSTTRDEPYSNSFNECEATNIITSNVPVSTSLPSEGVNFASTLNNVSSPFVAPCDNHDNDEPDSYNANDAQSDQMSLQTSLPDSAFDENSSASLFAGMSPMHLLRDSTSNSRWLEENINDFSLTSLLGHLDEINGNRDILDPSSNLSVISESSVDYMLKFQEITALMQNQDND